MEAMASSRIPVVDLGVLSAEQREQVTDMRMLNLMEQFPEFGLIERSLIRQYVMAGLSGPEIRALLPIEFTVPDSKRKPTSAPPSVDDPPDTTYGNTMLQMPALHSLNIPQQWSRATSITISQPFDFDELEAKETGSVVLTADGYPALPPPAAAHSISCIFSYRCSCSGPQGRPSGGLWPGRAPQRAAEYLFHSHVSQKTTMVDCLYPMGSRIGCCMCWPLLCDTFAAIHQKTGRPSLFVL